MRVEEVATAARPPQTDLFAAASQLNLPFNVKRSYLEHAEILALPKSHRPRGLLSASRIKGQFVIAAVRIELVDLKLTENIGNRLPYCLAAFN